MLARKGACATSHFLREKVDWMVGNGVRTSATQLPRGKKLDAVI